MIPKVQCFSLCPRKSTNLENCYCLLQVFYSSEAVPIKERDTLHKPSDIVSKYRVVTIFISSSFLYLHIEHEVLGGYENDTSSHGAFKTKVFGFHCGNNSR